MNEKFINNPLMIRFDKQRRDVCFDIDLTKRISWMNFNEALDDNRKVMLPEIEEYMDE